MGIQAVRGDRALEVSYMTYAQKMQDERRIGYTEGRAEGREEGLEYAVTALKGILDPAVIAERFNLPLEKIMEILEEA